MLTLALAVTLSSSQLTPFTAPPLVTSFGEPAPTSAEGSYAWKVLDQVAGGVLLGWAGMKLGGMTRNGDMSTYLPDMAGVILGSGLGFVGGLLLGQLARKGNLAGQIASVVLWGLGVSALGYEGYKIYSDVSDWCSRPKSFGFGGWGGW